MREDGVREPGWGSGGRALEALRGGTVLVGPFGSGKSEIAVNLAFGLRNRGHGVTLVDLDLVKPFFRCRLAKPDLERRGIRLVAPADDRFYADLPVLVPEARTAPRRDGGPRPRLILDVGGDDLGARVLGSLSALLEPAGTDLLFVVNTNRPFAEDPPALRRMLDAIQRTARLAVTGLVANTHLMDETTPGTVRTGIRTARALEEATGIPLRFAAVAAGLTREFGGPDGSADGLPLLAMERHIVAPFLPRPPGSLRRPAVV